MLFFQVAATGWRKLMFDEDGEVKWFDARSKESLLRMITW
jgi:hypothetical protein